MAGSLITFNKLSAGNRSSPTSIASLSFSLPFPRELSIRTEYGWESVELSIGGFLALQAGKNFPVGGNGYTGAAQSLMENIGSKANQLGAAAAVGATGGADGFGAAFLAGQGRLINPKLEVLFKGVKHREFELAFDLAPTTATDSLNVIRFLKELHIFAAPSVKPGSAFMEYPKTTNVVIRGDGSSGGSVTIDRGNCAITGIDANMTPDGVWATFKNGKPVHTTVTIKFLELDLPTKENDESLFG